MTGSECQALDLPCIAKLVLKETKVTKQAFEARDLNSIRELLAPYFLRRLQLDVIAQTVAKWDKTVAMGLQSQQ